MDNFKYLDVEIEVKRAIQESKARSDENEIAKARLEFIKNGKVTINDVEIEAYDVVEKAANNYNTNKLDLNELISKYAFEVNNNTLHEVMRDALHDLICEAMELKK